MKGGDLQIEEPSGRVVEQLKTRSDGGSFSLTELAQSVLPDLYLAVDEKRLYQAVRYRFVTQGHVAASATLRDLGKVLQAAAAGDPVELLSETKVVTRIRDEQVTERALFLLIEEGCERRRPDEAPALRQTKLRHLLIHFRIKSFLDPATLRKRLTQRFAKWADDPNEADALRQRAVGWVLEETAKGELRLDTPRLLRGLGLSQRPMVAWRAIRAAARQDSIRRLEREGYRTNWDVRPLPAEFLNWGDGKSVLIVPSESGQGGTWRSASLVHHLASATSGGLVIWVKATGHASDSLAKAAEMVWGEAMARFNASPNLSQLSRLRREQAPGSPTPWLTVVIDDVKEAAEARALLEEADWLEWEARLAIFPSPAIAEALKQTAAGDSFVTASTPDFTGQQVRDLLARHGRDAETLPHDVFELLRRPVVAGIYLKITGSAGWVPQSEYEICHRFWHERLQQHQGQANHVDDVVFVRRLVLSLLEGAAYPWTGETLHRCGITGDVRRRLEEVGWLRRPFNDERAEVWHDRLLNWAMAKHSSRGVARMN